MVDANKSALSNVYVSKKCYKELKILAIRRDVKMQEVVAEILENAMKSKIEKIDKQKRDVLENKEDTGM